MKRKLIKVVVTNTCDKCPFVVFAQFCLRCRATPKWRDIPVTILDTKTSVNRPHYIPDWCPFEDMEA